MTTTAFPERLLVWGLFSRGIALIYCISFVSLLSYSQVVALAGTKGINPISLKLKAIERDIPNKWIQFCRFPTLLWISSSDITLKILPLFGLLFSIITFIGGQWTPITFCATWVIYLSLDLPVGLKFPWDSLLLEAGFLAQLLPPTSAITSAREFFDSSKLLANHLPPGGVALLYRILLVRLMVGFGKVKFHGHKSRDNCYTHGFLISQPMPTFFGWLASKLPLVFHTAAIAGMFFIELILPWGIFFTGNIRFIAAVGIASLMLGIQLTGNFGCFNLLTIVLCCGSMDTSSSFTRDLWYVPNAHVQSCISFVVVPLSLSLALLNSLFQSWCNESWVHWPVVVHLNDFSALLGYLGSYCRFFSPFRIVSAYGMYNVLLPFIKVSFSFIYFFDKSISSYLLGVFPPASSPNIRFVTIIEGKSGGMGIKSNLNRWKEYEWRFMTSGKGNSSSSSPCFVAPFHPRIDHSIFYTSFGINGSNMSMSATTADPYGFNPDSSLCHRIGLRLLQGDCSVMKKAFFSNDPFIHEKPIQVRAMLYCYIPCSLNEWWQSGCTRWWIRRRVGEHMKPISLKDYEVAHNDRACTPGLPEMFSCDHLPSWYYKKTHDAEIENENWIKKTFWIKFVNLYSEKVRFKWDSSGKNTILNLSNELRTRFNHTELDLLKNMYYKCRTKLICLFEPHYFKGKIGHAVRKKLISSSVQNCSFSILELLANHIIAQGEKVYNKAIFDPLNCLLTWGVQKLTIDSGLFLTTLFHPDMMRFHARKWNIFARITFPPDTPINEVKCISSGEEKTEEIDADVECPVPPEFYVWSPKWFNQPRIQKALGVFEDQTLPLVIPPKVGELWQVDPSKNF